MIIKKNSYAESSFSFLGFRKLVRPRDSMKPGETAPPSRVTSVNPTPVCDSNREPFNSASSPADAVNKQRKVDKMSNAINMNWLSSAEGESLLHHFYDNSTKKRRFYGILERPALPSSIEEVTYKIFMIGRPGAGKSSVVKRLSGIVGDSGGYSETNGIKKTTIFWPVKIWDKIVLFKLQFWDTSENSIKKYNHILPACKDKADAICSVFSFDEPTSFRDIPYLMNSMTATTENPANIVIGTKYQAFTAMAVTDSQVKEFEERWKVKVIKIDTSKSSSRPEIYDCSYQMNSICRSLWNRDQEFISKQIIQV